MVFFLCKTIHLPTWVEDRRFPESRFVKRKNISMKYLLCLLALLYSCSIYSNNVQVSNVVFTQLGVTATITFDLQWENSWKTGANFRDAVWIFIKQNPNAGTQWQHVNVTSGTVDAGYAVEIPTDTKGAMIERFYNISGFANVGVELNLTDIIGDFQDIKVMAVEMVWVKAGQFFAGDGESTFRIARGDDVLSPVRIDNTNYNTILSCGSTTDDIQIHNQACVDLPAAYPKGLLTFYSMKYHITQGQYVDFLNCLPRAYQELHVKTDITGTSITNDFVMVNYTSPLANNGIRCTTDIGTGNITFFCDYNNNGIPNEDGDGLARPCNFLSMTDWMAYLDWSALRPFSFLEFEKAARGPLLPVPGEHSWGSTLTNTLGTIQNVGEDDERYSNSWVEGGLLTSGGGPIRDGANAPPNNSTRELANASYFGIIELGNNMADFYINYDQVSYEEIHGDGELSLQGEANVFSWPYYDPAINHKIKRSTTTIGISANSIGYVGRNYQGTGRGIRSGF